MTFTMLIANVKGVATKTTFLGAPPDALPSPSSIMLNINVHFNRRFLFLTALFEAHEIK